MKFECINLNDEFNWKMINYEYNNCKQFAGARNQENHMWDGNTLPASNEIIYVHNIPFRFPDKSSYKNDAIICEGQNVEMPGFLTETIYFLSMAHDDGTGIDDVIINYDDNTSEIIKVLFKEWYYLKANTKWNYNSVDVDNTVEGVFGRHLTDRTQRCIYMNTINIGRKRVISIELPFNPDIFIFAITVSRAEDENYK